MLAASTSQHRPASLLMQGLMGQLAKEPLGAQATNLPRCSCRAPLGAHNTNLPRSSCRV